MSTIIVETAAVAENFGSGLAWSDTTNALTENGLSSTVSFDGTNTDSQLLWLHDFGFSVPTTTELKVEGFSAKVIRTGTGDTEDLQVVLTYGATPSLTTSKHQAGLWASDDNTASYGSSSDVWNKAWTGSEINDTNFGFAMSAESPTEFDSGLVDFVELTLHYHLEYDEVPTGGSICGGTADIGIIFNSLDAGGAVGGGRVTITDTETPLGGVISAGAADPIHNFYQPNGGGIIGGSAIELTLHIPAIIGGTQLGGTPTINFIDQFAGTGGIITGGAADPVHNFYQPNGGALTIGSAVFDYTSNPPIGGGSIVLDASAFIDPYIGNGGSIASGTASVDAIYNIQASGGAISGGLALTRQMIPIGGGALSSGIALFGKVYNEIGSGGATILVGGPLEETAIIEPFFEVGSGGAISQPLSFVDPYLPVGGMFAGGLARQTQNYDTNLNPNEIQVTARGSLFVPPTNDTEAVVCSFTFNPVDGRIHWYIEHEFGTDLQILRIRFNEPGESGGYVVVSIDTKQDVTVSPVEGSIRLGPLEQANYLNGLHWIQFRTFSGGGDTKLRAQMVPLSSALAGGETAFVFDDVSVGGAIAGGSADVTFTSTNIVATGGAIAGGRSIIAIDSAIGGGIICGGIASTIFEFTITTSGGAITGGLAIDEAIYSILGTGGGIAAGKAIPGIAPKIGGGAITGGLLAGTPNVQYTSNPTVIGGGIVGGKARQTFIDQVIVTGHIIVGGQSLPAKIKFFNTQRLGYGRAMDSDNILNEITDDTVKLIPPTDDISPELKESRFRIQHNPGWCDVPVKCEEGVLAEVIVKRQKGIVPPKIRQDTPRSGGIVSAL